MKRYNSSYRLHSVDLVFSTSLAVLLFQLAAALGNEAAMTVARHCHTLASCVTVTLQFTVTHW